MPDRTAWGRCHYDDAIASPNYNPGLGVEYAECKPGYYCEWLGQDFALCMPDPHADHECCISWNNKCENVGDCCLGSECNANGYCEVGLPEQFEDPPGICQDRVTKTERKLWSRCYEYENQDQGDCAAGYICTGNHMYAQCEVDVSVKNDCCKWEYDITNPRPGDCCLGWMSHCHRYEGGECVESQCIPGRETGTDELGNSMLDVHDRLCTEVPPEATFNEQVNECTGAVCGVWGDPHIVTCDNLHYDCQAVGLFTLMKNHMFNVQANFVFIDAPWGGASVTNDIVIDYVKDTPADIPTFQFSFPNFENVDPSNPVYPAESKQIGACPVMFYLDGELVDISSVPDDDYIWGDANSDHSVKISGYNQIDVKLYVGLDENGEKYYSNSVVWIEGSGPFTDWSCILTYFICLPREEKDLFEISTTGLLGTPTGTISDDWMATDGQTLILPEHDRNQASFNYCLDNWCVSEDESIMTYEGDSTYHDYKCEPQDYHEFDINECHNADEIIAACATSPEPIACQMESCIGNPAVDDEINRFGDDDEENFLEDPDVNPPDYGDCANLGSGLSGSTGEGFFDLPYPSINSIFAGGFSVGHDSSVSVLVGGDFTCKQGAGFEGRAVFLGDMTLEENGCERLAATGHGSLIHTPDNHVCVEVGGDVAIDATFENQKLIMYEYGNHNRACHLLYKNACTLNGEACPNTLTALDSEHVYTNGDFTQDIALDLTRWSDEITLLQQKTNYWSTLPETGSTVVQDGVNLLFRSSSTNDPVQIFKISPIDASIASVTFSKELHGKTILIIVDGDSEFHAPNMCFHPVDALPEHAPICGRDTFPTELTASIAWVFPTTGSVVMSGDFEFQGSIVVPFGDLTANMRGHSGRLIVGGNLVVDGEFTELHNYEYDPENHPLPLGEELDTYCQVQTPPCEETYLSQTSTEVCPDSPDGIVTVLHSSHPIAEDEPILYDIIIEPPSDPNSAHTLKFKVDNPFQDHTDIFIKHVKKVGAFAMDPVCDSMPFTAGCSMTAPEIEVGCHEYDGVNPFALVNIYFASNTDAFVLGAGNDVTIDKCCKPPAEYESGYGIIELTLEVQCACPDGTAQQ